MEVRLDQLGEEPFTWEESLAFTLDELGDPDVLEVSEVVCRGRIRRAVPGFVLEMSLAYDQRLVCTRCLAEVTQPVVTESTTLVLVEEDATGEVAAERELQAEDLGVLVLTQHRLDTRPLVFEQLQLQVPMRSLCREDCAGLCPTCGADLNSGPCDCRKPADPRWAALARLKEDAG